VNGKVEAVRYARENGVPFFGICLGLQCATIEFARNVLGLTGANSFEFDKDTPHPVVCLMDAQKKVTKVGGTMRLGAMDTKVRPGTLAHKVYGAEVVSERHRHRFEFNNDYREQFTKAGFVISGTTPDGALVEVIELPNHPWFLGVQCHPEFKSKPTACQPLFRDFVGAAIAARQKKK
jgi:CTP synthase